MSAMIWFAAAGVVAVVLVLLASTRRGRTGDLGSVSGSWIAQHREN